MRRSFTLEYWLDEDWYVGRMQEVKEALLFALGLDDAMGRGG